MTHPVEYVTDVAARVLQLGLSTLPELSEQFVRAGRIPGAPKLRVAMARLADDTHLAESPPEDRIYRAIVDAGLPPPVRQFQITLKDGSVRRVDLAYPEFKLYIEIDGFWWHSIPGHKDKDDTRQNALSTLGWLPLRFRAGASASSVVATVREALGC